MRHYPVGVSHPTRFSKQLIAPPKDHQAWLWYEHFTLMFTVHSLPQAEMAKLLPLNWNTLEHIRTTSRSVPHHCTILHNIAHDSACAMDIDGYSTIKTDCQDERRLFSQTFIVGVVIFEVSGYKIQGAPIFYDHGRWPFLRSFSLGSATSNRWGPWDPKRHPNKPSRSSSSTVAHSKLQIQLHDRNCMDTSTSKCSCVLPSCNQSGVQFMFIICSFAVAHLDTFWHFKSTQLQWFPSFSAETPAHPLQHFTIFQLYIGIPVPSCGLGASSQSWQVPQSWPF